jgi:uridine nucleosidase
MAILAAFNSPEVEVIGLTSMYGNVPTRMATRNAITLCHLAGRQDVPVVEGAHKSLRGAAKERIADFVHGTDGFGNTAPQLAEVGGVTTWLPTAISFSSCLRAAAPAPLFLCHPPSACCLPTTGPAFLPQGEPAPGSAAEFIVRMASQHPGEVVVLALAALTNVALALHLDPCLAEKLVRWQWGSRGQGAASEAGAAWLKEQRQRQRQAARGMHSGMHELPFIKGKKGQWPAVRRS